MSNEWDGPTAIENECYNKHLWLAAGYHEDGDTFYVDEYGLYCPDCGLASMESYEDAWPRVLEDTDALRTQYTYHGGVWKHHTVMRMAEFDSALAALLTE